MGKKLTLLTDKQLGLLMEIVFISRLAPDDNQLTYQVLYLRKDEKIGITAFSELFKLSIDGYSTLDFYTLKTLLELTAANKLREEAEILASCEPKLFHFKQGNVAILGFH